VAAGSSWSERAPTRSAVPLVTCCRLGRAIKMHFRRFETALAALLLPLALATKQPHVLFMLS
jgi:hypothetical protein